MQELTHKTGIRKSELTEKSVQVFLQSKFIALTGNWQWTMNADAVFCSDVMLAPPAAFAGVRGIIHPDDVAAIKERLADEQIGWLQFRIITTYGEVKTISGEDIRAAENTAYFDAFEGQQAALQQLEWKKEYEQLQLQQEVYERTERLNDFGIWWYHSVTNKTWYSAQVFRMYDLAPHSLNPHLNTFNHFIHPEDREEVLEAFHRAYRQKLPLHIEYRINTARTEKQVLHTTQWFFNAKGEEILSGMLRDVTEDRKLEQKMEEANNLALLHQQQLAFDEHNAGTGHWQVNLVTRKTVFSSHYYRLFGLRPQSLPAGIQSIINHIHPEDRDAYAAAHKKMIYEHKVPELDFRVLRPDGKLRYFSQKAKLVTFGQELVMTGTIIDMTVQRMLEKKLKELTEDELITGFVQNITEEMAGVAGWVWNLSSGKITWSENFYRFLGYKPHAVPLTQNSLLQFIHPDDHKLFKDSIALVLSQKQETQFTFRLLQRGSIKHLKASFRVLSGGEADLFICSLQDITESHQLQQQLSERVQLAEALSENIQDRVIITDLSNNILLWNRQCEEVYGIRKQDAVGKNFFDVFPKLKTEEDILLFQRVLNGETIIQKNHKSALGLGYVDQRMMPLRSGNADEEISGIIHIMRDVTKEVELRQSLDQRVQFIESMVDASVDRIIAMDRNLNYLVWNKKCEEYYGLKKEQVIGRNVLELFPDTQNTPAFTEFKRVLKGETVYIPASGEAGKEGYHEIYLIPVKNEANETAAILWVLHDLSKEYDLMKEQRRSGDIINALHENYFELDHDYRITYINPKGEEFFGRQGDELIGHIIFDVFPQSINTPVHHAAKKAMEEREAVRGEFISPTSGTPIFSSMVPTDDGIAVIFFDVEKLKATEEKLQQHQDLLAQTASASPDSITVYDLEHNTPVYLNDRLAQWIGCSGEELANMGYEGRLQLIHPDDREKLLAFNREMMEAGNDEVQMMEYCLLSKNSSIIKVRNRSKVFKRNETGKVTHILSVLQDVTAEAFLRQQLVERTGYVETILDNSIDRIMVYDRSYTIVGWNRRSEEHTGIKKERAIGTHFFNLIPKTALDAEVVAAMEKALEGKYQYIPVKKGSYTPYFYERFYIPLKDASGATYAVLNIMHDVSEIVNRNEELKELNKTLEQKNKDLEARNEEITNFAFIASHDLREPLRKINTFSNWLLTEEEKDFSEKGKDYLRRIALSVHRMNTMIDDILVLTRIHADSRREELVDLNEVLYSVQQALEKEIAEAGAIVQVEALPVVPGHRNQLTQLFKNLVSNAVKFRSAERVPEIHISAVFATSKDESAGNGDKEMVVVCVQDNGIGIDLKYAGKLFQVFQRLHSPDEYTGTGMGLAICKKVMEKHNGFITVESEKGKGSVFCCHFPA